ncbi:hypothetical protein PUNSTDRAFT_113146 [Punctularia strigosozonata HHB-11173 SS5]|uniref:uncharacterized protein n=1 Tax=Punctularia strigosozonata (strain HHB-11173) TaxID=741275 RepID=UPI000441786E|nr:uncharacterized protein PUNSTDRAFT_113146 [Punctularia strigosozonata HHB-11173 SS5]EIN09778.1 hypothetical protein PUNSTDRAFT_113146 [Punctularia strigosozonata HHB-11173 SS5]
MLRRALAPTGRALRAARTYATPTEYSQPTVDPQLGGYDNPPYISRQRLPAKGWNWDPQMRRNFGDPLHEQEELLSMVGPDVPVVEPKKALRWFTIATLSFVTFGFLCKDVFVPDLPAVRREYPFDGLVTELGGLEENKARPEQISEDE